MQHSRHSSDECNIHATAVISATSMAQQFTADTRNGYCHSSSFTTLAMHNRYGNIEETDGHSHQDSPSSSNSRPISFLSDSGIIFHSDELHNEEQGKYTHVSPYSSRVQTTSMRAGTHPIEQAMSGAVTDWSTIYCVTVAASCSHSEVDS